MFDRIVECQRDDELDDVVAAGPRKPGILQSRQCLLNEHMHAWLQAAHIPSKLLDVLPIVQIQEQAHVTAAQIYLRRQLPCRALLLQECLEGIPRLGCHACRRCAETPFGRPEHSLANLDARKKRKA